MPSTAPKSAAPRKSAKSQPAPADQVETDSVVTDEAEAPATDAPVLRLKDLVDRVSASTGGKKKGVKEIVAATVAQLGTALGEGASLNLPAFGKLRVVRAKGAADGSAMTLKLRRSTAEGARRKPGKEALAEAEEQG